MSNNHLFENNRKHIIFLGDYAMKTLRLGWWVGVRGRGGNSGKNEITLLITTRRLFLVIVKSGPHFGLRER